ncbi:unnamed protein product [Brugia timori]|uniref:Uncharacterized protein n=1 Tax=Brugia timori TaxID=42155 RepID=A0A3P7XMK4_9BILA|nr:unnamed protein product [Brugia timori]
MVHQQEKNPIVESATENNTFCFEHLICSQFFPTLSLFKIFFL